MTFRSLPTLLLISSLFMTSTTAFADPSAALIEVRQEKFKDMGAAMKVFREELKQDVPDLQNMREAAARVAGYAPDIESWFPAGTGPDSGIETDALAYIWKNASKFTRVSQELVPAADDLVSAVAAGEVESIMAAVSAVGRACKACHQSFRAE